jgi:hypothetical protein
LRFQNQVFAIHNSGRLFTFYPEDGAAGSSEKQVLLCNVHGITYHKAVKFPTIVEVKEANITGCFGRYMTHMLLYCEFSIYLCFAHIVKSTVD